LPIERNLWQIRIPDRPHSFTPSRYRSPPTSSRCRRRRHGFGRAESAAKCSHPAVGSSSHTPKWSVCTEPPAARSVRSTQGVRNPEDWPNYPVHVKSRNGARNHCRACLACNEYACSHDPDPDVSQPVRHSSHHESRYTRCTRSVLILLRERRSFGPLGCAVLVHRLHPQYLPSGGSGGWNSPSAFVIAVGLVLPRLMPALATATMTAVVAARLAAIRPIPAKSTALVCLD
jgi:hypothetical protein